MATFTIDPPRTGTTAADHLAAHNLAANRAALARTQFRVTEAIAADDADLTWVFARDGYLTAMKPGDRWHTGCSIPLLAARAMLRTLDRAAGVACFLNPTHAAQVRVVLDHLETNQAVIAVVPDMPTLGMMLRCDDFSAAIDAGRLWFAWGEQWAEELGRLFEDVPGLASPSRFVRMPLGDPSLIDGLITAAQRVFAETNTHRTAAIADLRSRWTPKSVSTPRRSLCVIARSMFRLWDDAGQSLFNAMTAGAAGAAAEWRRFDADAPAGSSPLALASAAAGSDAIVAADVFRADAPNVVPTVLPWVTWVTLGRIPSYQTAGPRDRLLLADARWRDAAIRAGWPAERTAVAAWPKASTLEAPAGQRVLAIIADTWELDPPESLREYSSHLLLWETVRQAVLRDPFALPEDVDTWLREQAGANAVAVETLDVALFVNRLIVPAYQQALADALRNAGLPLRLHGAGWADMPAFRTQAAGAVTTRDELSQAVSATAALVHAWPNGDAHAIDSLGRPVVRRTGRRRETFLREATLALKLADVDSGVVADGRPNAPTLCLETVQRMLDS